MSKTISSFVREMNENKPIFTAGPASLLAENIEGLKNCFGRGDPDYDKTENEVLSALKKMSGQSQIARMQGSASLALEIMVSNFAFGRVLIVSSGYYSERLEYLARSAKKQYGFISEVVLVDWTEIGEVDSNFDWLISCYTETSKGLMIPIEELRLLADKTHARLMLDATASIGLEDGHELSDVMAFSSCKGLFGLTGAAFIAFSELPQNNVESFYLNLHNHLSKAMTGPYHSMCSLQNVLKRHDYFKEAVLENKALFLHKMKSWQVYDDRFQPNLCTFVNVSIRSLNSNVVLYHPRSLSSGSVVCHLGEVFLGNEAKGKILDNIEACDETRNG